MGAKSIKYLGINITKDLSKLYRNNYEHIKKNIREDIDRWTTYPMALINRINAVKMNVLPRLLYLFLSLPVHISKDQFCKWDKFISRFVWGRKRPRIRYTTLQLPQNKGGLALPHLKEYFHAAQLRQLICWCDTEYVARWKDIEIDIHKTPIQANIGEREIPVGLRGEHNLDPVISLLLIYGIL